jgi:hypothetical protein
MKNKECRRTDKKITNKSGKGRPVVMLPSEARIFRTAGGAG